MDNAVKAFLMAGGVIIGVMVLSVMVYMFRTGARLGQNYEQTQKTAQVIRYNGQFDVYSKITEQVDSADYGYSFVTKGNTASDIVTCANLAMSVNKENDYDEKNNIQVEVICGADKYYIYPIANQPKNKFIKNKSISEARIDTNFDENEVLDFYDFLKEYNNVRIVDIVSSNFNSKNETIYEHYFDVDKDSPTGQSGTAITYSEVTRKNK